MRPFRARALVAALALLAAGCQDYNFNPVGHCLIQPGGQSFTLSDISTADVLFVVDDSGSMGGEQARLAAAFGSFVTNLSDTNTARKAAGLPPIDFHLAVTTTSVFWNFTTTNQTCSSTCGSASGSLVCCISGGTPALGPKKCTTPGSATGCPTATTCKTTCNGYVGENYCCAADNTFPQAALVVPIACSRPGVPCGKLETHYNYAGTCATGSGLGIAPAQNGWPYPDGDFVGITTGGAGPNGPGVNPRVIHFDKRLYLTESDPPGAGRNAQGFSRAQLEQLFTQNVRVGTCGSGEEQGLQGGRLALQKALGGTQDDTYSYDYAAGLTSTSTPGFTFGWDSGTRTASKGAVWPRPDGNSKVVVVFVGDEDDCSSPVDPSGGVVMLAELAGNDACVHDANPSNPVGNKEFQVSQFVDYFTSLGRPVGAAFIESLRSTDSDNSCSGSSCAAGICCDYLCTAAEGHAGACSFDVCGGQAPGTRFLETAHQLQARGVSTVIGSVCDPNFGALLDSIAEIAKPPDTLTLPSVPAEARIAMLRIVQPNGDTRKICAPPLPSAPGNYTTVQQAQSTGADWWFTDSPDPGPPSGLGSTVAVPTKYVYINTASGQCLLAPGETWALDYLGVVPEGGCITTPVTDPDGSIDCHNKLGGQPNAFKCFVPPGLTTGTCTCGT